MTALSICKASIASYHSLVRSPEETALRSIVTIDRRTPLARNVVCLRLGTRNRVWEDVIDGILKFVGEGSDDGLDRLLEGLSIVSKIELGRNWMQ